MKNIKKVLFTIAIAILFMANVNAASGSIAASSSTRTAVVGSTFNVTVKVSCSEALGAWQFGINYDTSYLSLQSGDTMVADSSDGSIKTKTYTYKFKAIKSGTASVKISSPSIISWSENMFTPSVSNATVTIKTRAEIEASYSKDNTLKSLSVEGFDLEPEFDKNMTEYKISVPDTLEQVKVSAKVNDSNASVSGTGEVSISEGTNKVEIVVTAQNGSIKTYTILVDVKDLNPIEVKIDGEVYTVVKKVELMEAPIGYQATTIKIDDIEVPAFKSELTGFTIVGLKDEDGNIGLYTYDEDKSEYARYRELKGSALTIYPMEVDSLEGFEVDTLTINDIEYKAFKNKKNGMYVIYGLNVETGEKGYYLYDKDINSFIKYDEELFNSSSDVLVITIALGAISGILLVITILLAVKNSKLKGLLMKIKTIEESKPKKKKKDKEETE